MASELTTTESAELASDHIMADSSEMHAAEAVATPMLLQTHEGQQLQVRQQRHDNGQCSFNGTKVATQRELVLPSTVS
jgi:hypothetical protein